MSSHRFDKPARQVIAENGYYLRVAAWLVVLLWTASLATCG